jgi:hypothetical protein
MDGLAMWLEAKCQFVLGTCGVGGTVITKSTFPADAHALLYRPTFSVTMSARKQQTRIEASEHAASR